MEKIRKYIREILFESVTPDLKLKGILDSDEAYAILDNYAGGTWTEGGCAILAFVLSKIYNVPVWVLYNTRKEIAEHFVVQVGENKYMDYDGIHDNMLKDFKENELIYDPLLLKPYSKETPVGDIIISSQASNELYNLIVNNGRN